MSKKPEVRVCFEDEAALDEFIAEVRYDEKLAVLRNLAQMSVPELVATLDAVINPTGSTASVFPSVVSTDGDNGCGCP